jgi:hypothetical protein
MTILLILASTTAVLVLIPILLAITGNLPRPTYPLNDTSFRWALPVLLHQGEHGSVLFIQRTVGSEFLQYRKLVRAPGHRAVELGFPDSDWSRHYIDPLRQLLDGARVPYVVVSTEDEPTTRFILIDFGTDVDRAREVGLEILHRLFELPEEEFHLYFQGRFDPRPRAPIKF